MSIADAAAFLAPTWPVFPCGLDKKPHTEHGFKDATRDPDRARAWFKRANGALIGVPTGRASDLAVWDLDTKHGGAGLRWLAENEHRIPPTRRHRTPSGGIHLLFKYPAGIEFKNSAGYLHPITGKLIGIALGVDTRGEGGYICAPPSPSYEIIDDAMPADMPQWMIELYLARKPPPPKAAAEPYKPPRDVPRRYAEAALVSECEALARTQEGGRNHALNVAAVKLGSLVAAGALSEATVRQELRRAALHAGLDPRETDATIQSGLSFGMTQPREIPERERRATPAPSHLAPSAPAPGSGQPTHITDGGQQPEGPKVFPTLTLDEIEALPPPVWLIDGLLVQNSNASLIAPPKSLKSFLALDWALHIAYGIKWKGREVKQGGVLYIAGEGVGGMARRIAAWRAFHGCSGDSAPFRLIAVPFRIMREDHVAAAIATAKAMMEADGWPVALIVNDTLARSMAGADENSAKDMGIAVGGIDEIREATRSAMLTVHHTGKDKERGARGSSALLGAVDTEIVVTREESILRVKVTAQKDAEEGDEIVLQVRKIGTDGREPVEGQPSSLVLVEAPNGATPKAKDKTAGLPAGARFGLGALHEAMSLGGQRAMSPDYPEGVRIVPVKTWRKEFYARSHLENDDAKKKAFQRAINELRRANVVGVYNDWAWLIDAADDV